MVDAQIANAIPCQGSFAKDFFGSHQFLFAKNSATKKLIRLQRRISERQQSFGFGFLVFDAFPKWHFASSDQFPQVSAFQIHLATFKRFI